MKSTSLATLLLSFFLLLHANDLHAQSPCSHITFNVLNLGSCHYRLSVNNSSECYPQLRLLLDAGVFTDWNTQTQNGWTGEEISATEILLSHSSGHVPIGTSTPIDFYLPSGAGPLLTILWDNACPPGEGCFAEIPLTSCTIANNACISGINYVDVSCAHLPYSNQPGLAGWTITLQDAMGNTVGSTQTNASGAYSFCNLAAGTYIVKKTNQTGWSPSVPASGQYTVVLGQSAQVTRNFGSCRANCLCSSIQTNVQQITTSPTACCYSLSTQILGGGDFCFQYINVQVDAGLTITPSSAQTGWTAVQNGPQSIMISPPSGFVPNGSFTPVTFCVSGGTSHSILVTAGYNDSAGANECDKMFSFSCPNCNCPPPNGLAVSDVEGTGATISWIPATCSESTWVYVESSTGSSEHISRPSPVNSIVLDDLTPGAVYQVYAFSMCGNVMSGSSDTIRYIMPCQGLCPNNLVSNGSFSEPYVFTPTIPNAADQIGLCPGWQPATNGGTVTGTGDWFMYGSPYYFQTVVPGSFYDAQNNQYTILNGYCDPWYAGFDLSTCEGISTQLTSPIVQNTGYTIGFRWALKEPVVSNFSFLAVLSGGNCTVNTGASCTHQCSGDFHVPVNVTTAHQPGIWYFRSFTSTAPLTVSHLTFTANSSGLPVNNYVYIDEVCIQKIQICDDTKPRITQNPDQPNSFLGEIDLSTGSSVVSALWDFGDGTRDSSCCLGTVVHDYAPGAYNLCLTTTVVDATGAICSGTFCIQVVVPEVSDPCDDVTATLQPVGPGNCCYNLSINNTALNYFTAIEVTLSSGDFVNSLLSAGWSMSVNGNMATLTPINGSGFINIGADIPLTICNPSGVSPYTVGVDFVYNGGICHQSLGFSCDCCSQSQAEFHQTVDNATTITLDPAQCKATLTVGNLPCQRIDWINWGDFTIVSGPFTSGAMPMNTYTVGGPYTITYLVQELNPITGETCYEEIFSETINLDCDPDCHCGTWSNTSYRFGGAQNQPISCGGTTAMIPGTAPLAVYTDFVCQGTECPSNTQIFWYIYGPMGPTAMSGTAYPAAGTTSYSIFVPNGTFSLPGTYTFLMEGYCGRDTCICTLYIESAGICCMDYNNFCDLVNQGFTVQHDGCNVIVTAPQFGICNTIDATLDWGDGTPLISGTIAPGSVWTHSYNAGSNQTYNICANVYEGTCWVKQMCTPVTITCLEFCEQNAVQNDNFNQGIPNGFDQSINLATHWDGIWPAVQSTGDFYNTFSVPYAGTLTPPLPQSQGNFGGFWCAIQPGQWVYREGIMNELSSTLPASGTDVYDLSFKMACMTPINGAPSLSVFGVYTTGLSTGSVPINETTPLNAGLFPPGQAVEIATLPIPAFCDENFNAFNFQVNAALFPAQGMSHIFFTRTDNTQGDVYLAVDDVCLALQQRSCCVSQPDFEQVIESEVSINVDTDACSATLQTGDLPDCDAISEINWGDGNTSAGPFTANVSVAHSYQDGGNYSVSFTAVETGASGQVCFQTTRTQVVTPVCNNTCPCLGFSNMIFNPGQGGGPQSVTCGTDIILPCQDGTIYTLSGILNCASIGGCSASALNWQLFGPQGLVDAGTTTANPGFSISLPSGYFYVPGTYTLMTNALCNGNPCPCVIYFVVNPPCLPLCPCDVADFQADVLAGFLATHYTFLSCKVCFKGIALGPCDMVEWSVDNGPFSTPILGTQTYCYYNFAGNGTHVIQMRVTRKKGVNLICETFTFQKNITVNCNPVPVSDNPRVFNPGSHIPTSPLAPDNETSFRLAGSAVPSEKTVFRIFPNPNSGTFSVELSEAAEANTHFRIIGITGQVMQEQNAQTGSKSQTVEAGDLPGGLYFLQVVSDGNAVATKKFVKQ